MISSALMALEIKRNQRLRCQEARGVCGMFWKVWGILKRTWDQSVRTEIEKVSQKRQGSERLDARKSQTSRQIYSFFIKRENYWLTYTNKKTGSGDLEADCQALSALYLFQQLLCSHPLRPLSVMGMTSSSSWEHFYRSPFEQNGFLFPNTHI